jgi:anti-sigma regulatory factor (Ser/Thr protein kinase)
VTQTLRLNAELKDLQTIRQFVEDTARALGASDSAIDDLVLAIDETAANALEHGYSEAPGPLEIAVWRSGDNITVQLRDQAPPFDPTGHPAPDLTLPLDERPIGGVGIHLARQVVDTLSYRRTEQGFNEITLTKAVE